ncbi:MAG: acyl--CoA ligase [Novosphingobium sp.]|nr:acyl--CoA ligase [Novosphingobium sp.]
MTDTATGTALSIRYGGDEPPIPEGSLAAMLRRQAAKFGDRPAMLVPQDSGGVAPITYAEMVGRAENVARWLRQRCEPGSRIAIWSRNAVESVIVQHACALAGMVVAHFNTGWTDAEVRHACDLVEPSLGFAGLGFRDADLLTRLAGIASFPVVPLTDVEAIGEIEQSGDLPDPGPDAPYLIQFTSGTTGKSKGALLSQKCVLYGGWIRPAVYGGNEYDVWLNAVPYHHIGGSIAIIVGALATGSAFTVLERYDRDQTVRLMREIRPSRMGGVPTMWHDILSSPDLPSDRAVRLVTLGGATVPPSIIRAVQDKTGATSAIGYGQSESGGITNTVLDDPIDKLCETIGRPSPHTEVMIADSETGQPVPLGQVGEICACSPGNMMRYWGNPEATAATIRPDLFLRTGDLGSMDEQGYVRFAGRLREVIIRGGENIYPAEVEDALLSHPGIALAAVVKVPHERLGHEVGAVVTLAPGAQADVAAFEEHAASQIAHFKVPRHWRVLDEMPLTVSGKIRKVELEALFEDQS